MGSSSGKSAKLVGRPEPIVSTTYETPSVDIRVLLLTIAESRLYVALNNRTGTLMLPRGLPERAVALDQAARRIIQNTAGFQEQYLEQLYTLSLPDENLGWTVIVSYLALICSGTTPASSDGISWKPLPITQGVSEADARVIDYGLVRLRAKLGYTNIAFALLPPTFTLTELQTAYETVLGEPLDKRNFRRRMIAWGIVTDTLDKRREGSHRPAALYQFQSEHDAAKYLTPPWSDRS